MLQERLKKLKAEHGKIQLGNITVDMVSSCLLSVAEVNTNHSRFFFPNRVYNMYSLIFIWKVIGGMRGMTGLLWETSLLDPDEVCI